MFVAGMFTNIVSFGGLILYVFFGYRGYGLAFGLQGAMDGLPFKVLVIVSFMPVAFNALVPPAIYGFDLDLANSAWIVTTLALIVIVPGLYLALGV